MTWYQLLLSLWLCAIGASTSIGTMTALYTLETRTNSERFAIASAVDTAELVIAGRISVESERWVTDTSGRQTCRIEVKENDLSIEIQATSGQESFELFIPKQ